MNNKFNMVTVGKNARIAALAISEISDALISETLICFQAE